MSRGGRRGVPPDLKGTLGTLIRTTINQVGAMTDVARRQARSQKQRLDTALLDRRRRDALADLGEILYELATSHEIELDELPELARAVQEVEEIDRRIAESEEEANAPRRPVRLRPTGSTRARRAAEREPPRGERVWRPVPPPDQEPASEGRGERQKEIEKEVEAEIETDFESAPRRKPAAPRRGAGGGGIVFVDDEGSGDDDSLQPYMNEEDVPRRR
jgi:hypothetical protein